MNSSKELFSNRILCPVINADVTVSGVTVSLYGGPSRFPINIVHTVTGCDGAQRCRQHPSLAAALQKSPLKCPYHDSLNRGG